MSEQDREAAWENFLKSCDDHMVCGCDVCRGYASQQCFDAGYNANGWRRIEGPESLPKEEGDYLVSFRWKDEGPTLYVAELYYRPKSGWEEADDTLSERDLRAWRPMPPPFTE